MVGMNVVDHLQAHLREPRLQRLPDVHVDQGTSHTRVLARQPAAGDEFGRQQRGLVQSVNHAASS